MKKIIKFIGLIIVLLLIFLNYEDIIYSIKFSFDICINNLFPTIIPFMLLSNILVKYDFVTSISEIIGGIINKIFRVNKSVSFAFALSIFTGTPSNSKYLKDLYDNKFINEKDISKALNFCHFTNPIFILGTVGKVFLKSKRIGLNILISHILGGIILGIINRGKKIDKINIKEIAKKNIRFIKVLNESIINTSTNLILILGVISTSLIITTIINSFIKFDDNYKFIYGLIEITQGLKYLSMSNLSLKLKGLIATFLVSFGGFSIHAQNFSILENKKIRYIPYLISRILHGIISSLIFLFINAY